MPTYVSDYTALISEWSWTGGNMGAPMVVTYSFDTVAWSEAADTYGQAGADSFVPFSAAQQAMAEQAFAAWAAVSGIIFIEVPPGQGDIRLGNFDFDALSPASGAAGFAYYPSRSLYDYGSWESALGGDVFIDTGVAGNMSYGLILHEIGHAIGLSHSHEGDIQLEDAYDNTSYTVMSYNWSGTITGLGPFDIEAAQHIYGPANVSNPGASGVQAFSVDAASLTTTQSWGGAASEIFGSSVHDIILAGGGADTVGGFGGDDVLNGQGGDDTLIGGAGADTLIGGLGDDQLIGGIAYNQADTGDTVSFAGVTADVTIDLGSYEGSGYIRGSATSSGTGTDTLYNIDNALGGGGNDVIDGNRLANLLNGGAGDDTMSGGDGNDTLRGGSGRDRLVGDAGDDLLSGGDQIDRLLGMAGDDTLRGDDGSDVLRGGDDDDLANGGNGADTVLGGTGRDTLNGDAQDDVVRGNGGFDVADGGAGDDLVAGGAQADLVLGGAGNDTVQGGGGFDTIDGGTGNDELTGNFNADQFIFADGHGDDTITDFEATNNAEKIDLSAVSAITSLVDLNLGSATNGAATQVGTDVLIDTGGGDSILLVGVSLSDLDANDFIL